MDVLALVALAALAWTLRAGELGPPSLWLDDAWVAVVHRVDSVAELRLLGLSAPGFVAMLRGVFAVTGFSEVSAQALPFAAGVASVPLTYVVARAVPVRRPAGVVAAVVLATSPIAIDYATRVKQYTVESVLALVLLWCGLWLVRDVGDRRRWAAAMVLGAVATAVSAFVAPYVAALAAAGLVQAARARDATALRSGIAASAAYAVAAAVWYLAVLRPVISPAVGSFWADAYVAVDAGPRGFLRSLGSALLSVADGLSGLPALLVALVVGACLVAIAARRPVLAVLLATPLAVAVVLASIQLAPLGGGRTDVYLYPSFVLAVAAALDLDAARRGPRTGPLVHWVVAAAIAGASLVVVEPPTPYPVYDVAPLVQRMETQRDDAAQDAPQAVLVYPATMWAYAVYTDGEVSVEREASSAWGFAPRFARERTHVLPPGRDDPDAYLPTVRDIARGDAQQVWLLASHWRDDYRALQQQLEQAGFTRVEVVSRTGAELSRWQRG